MSNKKKSVFPRNMQKEEAFKHFLNEFSLWDIPNGKVFHATWFVQKHPVLPEPHLVTRFLIKKRNFP
jgi:cytochrome b involved in lipid metabolism